MTDYISYLRDLATVKESEDFTTAVVSTKFLKELADYIETLSSSRNPESLVTRHNNLLIKVNDLETRTENMLETIARHEALVSLHSKQIKYYQTALNTTYGKTK